METVLCYTLPILLQAPKSSAAQMLDQLTMPMLPHNVTVTVLCCTLPILLQAFISSAAEMP